MARVKKASDIVEMNAIDESDSKPSSAPSQSLTEDNNVAGRQKSLIRRSTGSKKRKAKMSSSSSLHSLVSILKPTDSDQRSAPNVSFGDDYNDINVGVSRNSLSVNMNPSLGETSSQYHYTMEEEENFRIPGGSFSTQNSTIGFRASFFSVLEKLGVWRSQDVYKASQNVNETKVPPDRKTARNSITSLYFRTIYGGKYNHKVKSKSTFNNNLLQSITFELECEKIYLIDKRHSTSA